MEINKKYKPLFEDFGKSKFYQVYGGRAGGKTYAAKKAMLKYIFENKDKTIVYSSGFLDLDLILCDFIGEFLHNSKQIDVNKTLRAITCRTTRSKIIITNDIFKYKSNIMVLDDPFGNNTTIKDLIKNHKKIGIDSYVFIYNEPIQIIKEHFFVNGKPNNVLENTTFIYTDYRDNLNNLNDCLIDSFTKEKQEKQENMIFYKNVIPAKFK